MSSQPPTVSERERAPAQGTPLGGGAFRKRIISVSRLWSHAQTVLGEVGALKGAYRDERIGERFVQRLWLAVTSVNECRICSFAHTRAGRLAGLSRDEMRGLLSGELADAPEEELEALAFVQHAAELEGRAEQGSRQRLLEAYGESTARHLEALTYLMLLNNLAGNTLDALLSRARRRPAPGSSLLQELGVLACWSGVWPFIGVKWLLTRAR